MKPQYKVYIQTIPDVVFELSNEGKFIFISDGIKEFGYKPKQLIGKHFSTIIHPGDQKDVDRSFVLPEFKGKVTGDTYAPKMFNERRTKDRMTRDLKIRIVVKTKKKAKIEYQLVDVQSAGRWGILKGEVDRNLIGSIGIFRKVGEHKKLDDVINVAENNLVTLVNKNIDGIVVVNKNGVICFSNPAADKLFNSKKGMLIGKSFGFPLETDKTCEITISSEHHDSRIAEMQAVEIEWCGETAYLAILRDVTLHRTAEKNLQDSYEKLSKVLDQTVNSLASAAEKRDQYTAGHQKRVAKLACAIAKEMGIPKEKIKGIHVAGVLHDIGKIYIADALLTKLGRLTEEDFDTIKNHSRFSYEILKEIDFPWPVAEIVLQHHERLDGSGYPNHLKDDKILIEAKILAVADVVEAMSSDRPYRPALGIDKALEEVSIKEGTLYDPEAVEACCRLFKEKGFKLI